VRKRLKNSPNLQAERDAPDMLKKLRLLHEYTMA
jgi:hypothetical protein